MHQQRPETMKRIVISGGGTGGHVYPAIAIAQEIRKRDPEADILFIGASGRMEMAKVPAAGFRIEGLPIAGLIRRITWKNLLFPFRLINSLVKAYCILKRFKPDLAIGVGGYASGPTLRAAAFMRIPILLQEQNSFPGITNRLLAKKARTVCVAYEGMSRYFGKRRLVLTGNPVRRDLIALSRHLPEAYTQFDLRPDQFTILVIGGSGGARTINDAILKLIREGLPESAQLLWQTGKYYFSGIVKELTEMSHSRGTSEQPNGQITEQYVSGRMTVVPFINRMEMAYSCADLVVSRAGAIAISELCLIGLPVILIPSPNVAEDHQTRNAKALSEKNAALMIPDAEATNRLSGEISRILPDDNLRADLSRNIRLLAIPDATERIVDEMEKMLAKDR